MRPSIDPSLADSIVVFVRKYQRSNGYAPSYREIAQAIGVGSTHTVNRYLTHLAEEGRVKFLARVPRSVHVL